MDSIQDLTPEIQKRISDFEIFLSKSSMKRPEVKFTGAILTSMLKEHHVHLTPKITMTVIQGRFGD